MPDIMINGPVGNLEGKYRSATDPRAPLAVLLHPHPQFKGTMNELLLYQAYYSLFHRGYSVLRFNFRGVGKSQGDFDHGEGELEDAAACLDWMENKHPQARSALVLGFSFGAWVGMHLMSRRPEITKFCCLAPPAGLYDFSFISTDYCQSTGLVVGAEYDAVAPPDDVQTLVDHLNQKKRMVEYSVIPGANHFFDGHQQTVIAVVSNWLEKGSAA